MGRTFKIVDPDVPVIMQVPTGTYVVVGDEYIFDEYGFGDIYQVARYIAKEQDLELYRESPDEAISNAEVYLETT